jgi:ParB family chromosome partitioning protein
LGALIRDTPAEPAAPARPGGAEPIDIAKIRPNRWQPRRTFAKETLEELAASIREHGVLEPVIVRKVEDGYELIAGERRWRAAQQAGLRQIPALAVEATDQKALELALVENLQRSDLNVIEEAEGYQTLSEKFGLTQDEIAQRVNKARASVANALRLLSLPPEIKQFVSEGLLSAGHAKVLLGLVTDPERCRLAERAIKEGLSVRDLERIVERGRLAPRKRREVREEIPASHIAFLADKLHSHFGTSVRLDPCRTLANGRKLKGMIQIDYYSNDDLSRILELLGVRE